MQLWQVFRLGLLCQHWFASRGESVSSLCQLLLVVFFITYFSILAASRLLLFQLFELYGSEICSYFFLFVQLVSNLFLPLDIFSQIRLRCQRLWSIRKVLNLLWLSILLLIFFFLWGSAPASTFARHRIFVAFNWVAGRRLFFGWFTFGQNTWSANIAFVADDLEVFDLKWQILCLFLDNRRPLFWLLYRLKWTICHLIDETICHSFVFINPRCRLYRWQSLFDIVYRLAFLGTDWPNRDDVVIVFIVVTCMHRLEELFAALPFWISSIAFSPSATSSSCVGVRFRWNSRFLKFLSVSAHPERFLSGKGLVVIGPLHGKSLGVFGLLVLGQVYVGV